MSEVERGYGKRVRVTAAADRTSGAIVVEDGWHGIVTVTTVSGKDYNLNIEQREYETAFITSSVKGTLVYIDDSNVLTLTSSANRLVGKVTEVQGGPGVPSGKMTLLLMPNNL